MTGDMTGRNETQRRLEQALGVPFCADTHVRPLNNGDEIFPAMLRAIARARYRIEFATYVYWQGEIARRFARALAERARAGVRVRVLLDAFGAKAMREELRRELQGAGVEVRWFRPMKTWQFWRIDKRMHRKILVCDDRVGFTGGVGVAAEWEGNARDPGEWRDMHFELSGAVIHGLRAAFLDNWNESGDWQTPDLLSDLMPRDAGEPDGPPAGVGAAAGAPSPAAEAAGDPMAGGVIGPVHAQVVRSCTTLGWNDITTLLRLLVAMSRRELRIVTPYFNPDAVLVDLLRDACRRGVDVELVSAGRHTDSRLSQLAGSRALEHLVGEGARAWHYQKTMLHVKLFTVDGAIACVGSANLNQRTLAKDEECCVLVHSAQLTEVLNRRLDQDLDDAEPVTSQQLAARGRWRRCQEACARVIERQL